MHRFWNPIIKEITQRLQPKSIVEIGIGKGWNSQQLLRYCKEKGGMLHSIDPDPKIDMVELTEGNEDFFVWHHCTSLEALPAIDAMDLVLIDGDHNWYTVFHELKTIESTAKKSGSFPLVMLHDIHWPYGKRDMYYKPNAIPEQYRHKHAKIGVVPGQTSPTEEGINRNLFNATVEGGPRNGVYSAIVDFLEESKDPPCFWEIPGFHGLGILGTKQHRKLISDFLAAFCNSAVQRHISALEADRVQRTLETKQRILTKETRTDPRIFKDMETDNTMLLARVIELEKRLTHITNTRSWRITHTLRTLSQYTKKHTR